MINTRTAKAAAAIGGLSVVVATVLRRRAAAAAKRHYTATTMWSRPWTSEADPRDVVDAVVMDDEVGGAVMTSIGETANGHILYRTIEPKDDSKGSRTYVRSRPFWLDDDGLRVYSER
jgi:hypothetical protein